MLGTEGKRRHDFCWNRRHLEASGRLEASGGPLNQEVHFLRVLARTGKLRSMLVHFFLIVNSLFFFDLSSLMCLKRQDSHDCSRSGLVGEGGGELQTNPDLEQS